MFVRVPTRPISAMLLHGIISLYSNSIQTFWLFYCSLSANESYKLLHRSVMVITATFSLSRYRVCYLMPPRVAGIASRWFMGWDLDATGLCYNCWNIWELNICVKYSENKDISARIGYSNMYVKQSMGNCIYFFLKYV